VVQQGGGLVEVIWIAIAGEAIGFAVSLVLVRYRIGLSMRPLLPGLVLTAALMAVSAAGLAGFPDQTTQPLPWWEVSVLALVLFGALILSLRDLRKYVAMRVMATSTS
jgi:hypothetical protein